MDFMNVGEGFGAFQPQGGMEMGMGGFGASPMLELMELIFGLVMGMMGGEMMGGAGMGGSYFPGVNPGFGAGGCEGPSFGGSGGPGDFGDPINTFLGNPCGFSSGASLGGAAAVQMAQSKLGQQAQDVRMPNYTHAGGCTNDCADFVSALVANTEGFHKNRGDANVRQFQRDLRAQGWQQVSRAQAQPGDVAIILGGGVEHTELVTAPGARQAIGSNGTSQETVGTDNLNWATGVTYWHKPQGEPSPV